mgnify:CR=1 FL=1
MLKYLYDRYKNLLNYFIVLVYEILFPYQIFKYLIYKKDLIIFKDTNNLSILILILLWVFISYLRERYSKLNINNSIKTYLLKLKEILFISFMVGICLFSLKVVGLDFYLNTKNLPLFFIILITVSILKEIFIVNISLYISSNKYKEIFILGTEIDLDEVKNILKNYDYDIKSRFKIIDINYKSNFMPDQLIITKEHQLNYNELRLLKTFLINGVQITSKNKWFENELNCLPVELLNDENFIDSKLFWDNKNLQFKLKRFLDIVFSFFLLILSLPIILISGLLIWLSDRGPVLYQQEREGLYRRKFNIYKLRSMIINAETSGPQWSTENDKRITLIGTILRKTRIDELPQLVSVLKGDMSLIGPRPERTEFNKILDEKIPYYNLRHLLKPGLSGWAQVNYPYSSSLEESKHKLSYDLYYISNYSIFLDLIIFFKTMRIVFSGKGL